VRSSMNTLLFVGGSIVMFSVLLEVLTIAGVVPVLGQLLATVLGPLDIHPTIVDALVRGTMEITIGSRAASIAAAPLLDKAVAVSAIIPWRGLSVHAQVAVMVHGTDIRLAPYFLARTLHALLAAGFTWLIMGQIGRASCRERESMSGGWGEL